MSYRSLHFLPALVLAGLSLFLISCPKPTTVSKDGSPGPDGPTGPGGDDDRPVTILGSSLILVWYDKDGALPDNGVYAHSNNGASLNAVEVEVEDLASGSPVQFQLKRKTNQPLALAIEMNGASELTASTNPAGKNLKFQTAGGGDLSGWKHRTKNSKTALEFPAFDRKLSKLTLTGVVLDTGTAADPCTVDNNAMTVTCSPNTSHAVRTVVTLRVCKGAGCKNPAP